MASFEPYQHALGIRSLALPAIYTAGDSSSATSSVAGVALLAVGSFDGKVRVLSTYSWQLAFVLPLVHPKEMDVSVNALGVVTTVEVLTSAGGGIEFSGTSFSGDASVQIGAKTARSSTATVGGRAKAQTAGDVRSVFRSAQDNSSSGGSDGREIGYVTRMAKALPRLVPDARAVKQNSFPAVGVSWVGFSADGALLAAREESYPRCLWVWNPVQCRLEALLVQLEAITCAQWRPRGVATEELPSILAFCCGNSRVYFWNSWSGATWADSAAPDESAAAKEGDGPVLGGKGGLASIVSLQWSECGTRLLLRGKEAHSTCTVDLSAFASLQRPVPVDLGLTAGATESDDLSGLSYGASSRFAAADGLDARLQDLDDEDNYL